MHMIVSLMYVHMTLVFSCLQFMQDDLGFTALGVACQEGHTEVAHLLIEKGATVDYQYKVSLLLQCSMCIITVALIE